MPILHQFLKETAFWQILYIGAEFAMYWLKPLGLIKYKIGVRNENVTCKKSK